jgi:hypothetical protein
MVHKCTRRQTQLNLLHEQHIINAYSEFVLSASPLNRSALSLSEHPAIKETSDSFEQVCSTFDIAEILVMVGSDTRPLHGTFRRFCRSTSLALRAWMIKA